MPILALALYLSNLVLFSVIEAGVRWTFRSRLRIPLQEVLGCIVMLIAPLLLWHEVSGDSVKDRSWYVAANLLSALTGILVLNADRALSSGKNTPPLFERPVFVLLPSFTLITRAHVSLTLFTSTVSALFVAMGMMIFYLGFWAGAFASSAVESFMTLDSNESTQLKIAFFLVGLLSCVKICQFIFDGRSTDRFREGIIKFIHRITLLICKPGLSYEKWFAAYWEARLQGRIHRNI